MADIPPPAAPAAAAAAPAAPSAPAAPGGGGDSPSATEAFETQFDLPGAAPKEPTPPPAAPTAPAAPAAKATPGKAPAKPAAPTAPAPAAPAQEFEEVDGVKVPKFKSDKEFRGWGLNGYKKASQLETELTGLRAKHTELEQKVPRTEAERTQLATKLADLEKKHNEVLAELNFANYERSPDYKTKYEKPYQDAFAAAYEDISQLTVTEEDRSQPADGDGKYPTKERQATQKDFDEIYTKPLGEATKLAAKKFGQEQAPTVMDHWREIRKLAKNAVNALEDWKKNAATREKETQAQTVQNRERVEGLWKQVNEDIRTKNQDLFGERPDDKEWNTELTKGTQMADAYFSDRSAHTVDQRVIFDAHVRNRVAAFPALVSRMRKLEAENAQLTKDITELRGSGPGKPNVDDPNPPAQQSEGAMAEFDKIP